MGAITTPLFLGVGWVVRRVASRKDEHTKKMEEAVLRSREEAEELNRRYLVRTEEVMELKAERTYLTRMLDACEKEISRLKGEPA